MEKLVRIKGEAHAELEILADKHQRSMKQFTEQMIAYFKKFKIDPADLKDENVSVALRSLRNDLIGFIKTQEKDKLIPTLEELRFVSQHVQQATTGLHSQASHQDSMKTLEKWLSALHQELYGVSTLRETRYSLRSHIQEQREFLEVDLKATHQLLATQGAENTQQLGELTKVLRSSLAQTQAARQENDKIRCKANELFLDYLKELDQKGALASRKPIDDKYHGLFSQL